MHPRTDVVVITAVLDESGEKILLGRNVRNRSTNADCDPGQRLIYIFHNYLETVSSWFVDLEQLAASLNPTYIIFAGFYSTLSGFLEPSESLEDAVVREIW